MRNLCHNAGKYEWSDQWVSRVAETSAITLGQILLLNKILIFYIFLPSLGCWPEWLALSIGEAVHFGLSSFSQLFKALFAWFASLVASAELPPLLF